LTGPFPDVRGIAHARGVPASRNRRVRHLPFRSNNHSQPLCAAGTLGRSGRGRVAKYAPHRLPAGQHAMDSQQTAARADRPAGSQPSPPIVQGDPPHLAMLAMAPDEHVGNSTRRPSKAAGRFRFIRCNLNIRGEHHAYKMARNDGFGRSDPGIRLPRRRDDQQHACRSGEIG
jgi:hypothetical protein